MKQPRAGELFRAVWGSWIYYHSPLTAIPCSRSRFLRPDASDHQWLLHSIYSYKSQSSTKSTFTQPCLHCLLIKLPSSISSMWMNHLRSRESTQAAGSLTTHVRIRTASLVILSIRVTLTMALKPCISNTLNHYFISPIQPSWNNYPLTQTSLRFHVFHHTLHQTNQRLTWLSVHSD